MQVRYYCHYGAITGYGRAARDYLAALEATDDVELEIAVLGDVLISPEPRYSHLDQLAVPYRLVQGDPEVEIVHAQPRLLAEVDRLAPTSLLVDGKVRPLRIALTTWETSELPSRYAVGLSTFNRVIVPSEFCAGALAGPVGLERWGGPEDNGWRPDIVPHCFDEEFWPPPTLRPRRPREPCRFYSIGAWGERKNMLGILRAYLHAFTKADKVHLLMLIEQADFDEIRAVIASSGIPADDLPALTIPTDVLTEDQLVELHATADCFVSATRGEGWGLGLFEAAIMGRQIISPLWGGQSDFLDEYESCAAVPYQLAPCFGALNKIERDGKLVEISARGTTPGVTCKQVWADPDLVALASEMRSVYESGMDHGRFPRTEDSLRTERERLELAFGYRAVGSQFVNLLREIAAP